MEDVLPNLLNLYDFSTGRRMFAIKQVQERAAQFKLPDVVACCEAARGHDRKTLALEARWDAEPVTITYSPEMRATDIAMDNLLTALRDTIDGQIRGLDPNDPLALSAAKLGKILFPQGVGPITSLGYVEEIQQVDRILGVLADKAWKKTVTELGIHRHIARLKKLARKYHELLETPEASLLKFSEVDAARKKGQRLLYQAVAKIIGRYSSDSSDDIAACNALLGPILEQNDAVREYLRVRRAVQDVNPDTGEVDTGSDKPAKPT